VSSRPEVLVITTDRGRPAMAGHGIRAFELAKSLQPHANVTFAAVESDERPPEGVDHVPYRLRAPGALRPHVARADAIVAQPPTATVAALIRRADARVVYDLFTPEPIEAMEIHSREPTRLRALELALARDRLLDGLHDAHHLLCAGSRQRDLYLGAMLGEGLISPDAYLADPTFLSRIGTVPFGIPDEPPRATTPGPRETLEGLDADSELLLWNGGIWAWFDAPTAIRAMALLADRRPRARLVFMGRSSATAGLRATEEARRVAAELRLLGRSVLFHDGWVSSYGERPAWLLQADCIVATDRGHLEARYSFRTRLLDALWAAVPAVCTSGNELADEFERLGLGATVAPGDAEALAAAIETVLDRGRAGYAEAFERAAPPHRWTAVAEPLVRYVTAPEVPPRLGAGARRRLGVRARAGAYRVGIRALDAAGRRRRA
jgi:glycosyltransferase involved in cell wall biosynthesis